MGSALLGEGWRDKIQRLPDPSGVFESDFLTALRVHIGTHHSIYAKVPPQGIYFEALVEEAFRTVKKPYTVIEGTSRNQPSHDLLVENKRLSLKTETGTGTHPDRITITKLCTTEREPWTADVLVQRVLEHLERYDIILMLRAIWKLPLIRYDLLEIPTATLKLIRTAAFHPVGKRAGKQSIGADVLAGEERFHVHFDASDGKCSMRNLPVSNCAILLSWEIMIRD
ncbi:MAG: hypothetical protein ACRD96_17365 [Bryobacteraceae bacterium]